jgi:hypothetical protein
VRRGDQAHDGCEAHQRRAQGHDRQDRPHFNVRVTAPTPGFRQRARCTQRMAHEKVRSDAKSDWAAFSTSTTALPHDDNRVVPRT